jgi:hypothetical protein
MIADKFNKEEVITNSQIMKLAHQHKKSIERKTEWNLNFMKLKPTSKQRKPIPIQSSQRKKNEESK